MRKQPNKGMMMKVLFWEGEVAVEKKCVSVSFTQGGVALMVVSEEFANATEVANWLSIDQLIEIK